MDNIYKAIIPYSLSVMIIFLSMSAFGAWVLTNQQYISNGLGIMSVSQSNVNGNLVGKSFPVIEAKNIRTKLGHNINIMDSVLAVDVVDGDLTNKVEIYGDIDISKKGLYKVRLVVKNSLGLKTTKTIQVLVD